MGLAIDEENDEGNVNDENDDDKKDTKNRLLYADDLICIADNEEDLQTLINIIHNWGIKWRLEINLLKTNIMHVRPTKRKISSYIFKLGHLNVQYCQQYKYLGTVINEHLNFNKMALQLHDSASRALGSIICKMKKCGGFPLNTYKLLIESCVYSISDYCTEVYGFYSLPATEKIHLRVLRTFLGVKKSAPVMGIKAEFGWLEPKSRAHIKMVRYYLRLQNMDNKRLTKRIFLSDMSRSKFGTVDC